MKRRSFVYNATMVLGSSFLAGAAGSLAQSPKKPNILFLFADDHCFSSLGAFGSEVETPNLDKLVAGGTSFSNAYIQGSWSPAVCIASRAMLNTGRFLWHARSFNYKQLGNGTRLWSQYLQDAGYDTYMTGKWHVNADADKVFKYTGSVRGGMPNQSPEGYNRPKDEQDYEEGWKPWDKQYGGFWKGGKHWSEVLGDEGVQFIGDSAGRENPFFMYLAFNAPHDPRQSPKKFVDKYPLSDIKVPENFLPEYPYNNDIGNPRSLRDERLAPFPRTEYSVKVNRQEYYAIITHMDEQIGRILKVLDESGERDNTYVFFCGDHGLAVGQHGFIGKQNMYEHSIKSPLLVSGPGLPQGQRIEAPVYIQDLFPTSLELAGISVPPAVEFKSLLPLIKGERKKSYDAIYGAYLDLQRMVRVEDYKLIYYTKIDKVLLYNLREDPNEMNDLAADPKYAPVVKNMFKQLMKLQQETGDQLKLEPACLA